jgi:hypothetical protein
MVDVVECRSQVCVEDPLAFRVFALNDLVDRLDRIMAPTARPEALGLRLKPRFAG